MKYFVSLVRPVFERAVVEIEAQSLVEAQEKALEAAGDLPDTSWKGAFDPSGYAFHIERAAEAEDVDSWADESDGAGIRYALLQADVDSGEGNLLPQPWMAQTSALLVADVGEDWIGDLESLQDAEVTSFIQHLKEVQKKSAIKGNVVSFAKYVFLRRLKEAELDD